MASAFTLAATKARAASWTPSAPSRLVASAVRASRRRIPVRSTGECIVVPRFSCAYPYTPDCHSDADCSAAPGGSRHFGIGTQCLCNECRSMATAGRWRAATASTSAVAWKHSAPQRTIVGASPAMRRVRRGALTFTRPLATIATPSRTNAAARTTASATAAAPTIPPSPIGRAPSTAGPAERAIQVGRTRARGWCRATPGHRGRPG